MWLRWLVLGFVVACGGVGPAIQEPARGEHVEPTGLRVITLPRPTPDVVRLSLWIDAGSRDASPPQVATLSAWIAARASGGDVQARVLPDATELWVECPRDKTEQAVETLSRALATRDVDDATWNALQGQLRAARAADETDGRQVAERNALTAALGEALANELRPLGRADDDPNVTIASARAFLTDHFGPNRALLVSVGDLPAAALSRSIGVHLAAVPRARRLRAERALPRESAQPAAIVERAGETWSATAVASTDRQAARKAARTVGRAWSARAPETHELSVRGGTIAVVVARHTNPVELIRQAATSLADSESATHHEPHAERAREDLAALAETAGIQFCAPATDDSVGAIRIGYGVSWNDAARAGPEEEQRAETRIRTLERDLQQVTDAATRPPRVRGDIGTQAAHVVLDNGVRISVQRRASDNVGIAIRFLGGASEEHHTSHGRTALLSLLSAQACEGVGPGALTARLNALGAELVPVLDATSFGLRMSAPAAHWNAGLDLIARCAIAPALNRRGLRDAQARMLSTLAADAPHGKAALVAKHLAPTHPGTVAPWGDASSALLDLDSISRAHAVAAVGARISVAVVGDVPVAETVATLARRFQFLPAGALPRTPEASGAPEGVGALPADSDTPSAIVMFRVLDGGLEASGVRAFAALLGEELTRTPSITLTWLDAGTWTGGAWAAVGLSMPVDTLNELNRVVERARQTLAAPAGRSRTQTLIATTTRQHGRTLSEPSLEADARAQQLVAGLDSAPDPTRAMHAFDSFVQARPAYLVSRGRALSVPRTSADNRP